MRGGIGYLGNLAFFFAIAHIAIGDAITIQFSRPLFMVLIAGLFLGEVVGRRRISVTLIGFLGIIMITRPFGGGFEPWVLVAVGLMGAQDAPTAKPCPVCAALNRLGVGTPC